MSGPQLQTLQRGVWTVFVVKDNSWNPILHLRLLWRSLVTAAPMIQRFSTEIYSLEPIAVWLYLLLKLWTSMESSVMLYFTRNMFGAIEAGVALGSMNTQAILQAFLAKALCSMLTATTLRLEHKMYLKLQSSATAHFDVQLLEARLNMDLSTASKGLESYKATTMTGRSAFAALDGILGFLHEIVKTVSQLSLMLRLYRSRDPLLLIVYILQPLCKLLVQEEFWALPYVYFLNNLHYQRKYALERLAVGSRFKQEILNSNIVKYVLNEYRKAIQALGEVPQTDWPLGPQAEDAAIMTWDIALGILDFPLAYSVFSLVRDPKRFPVSSIAMNEQFVATLRLSFDSLLYSASSLNQNIEEVKSFQVAVTGSNQSSDGSLDYQRNSPSSSNGMEIELRNACYSYSSVETHNVVDNFSLSIKPGQLVVVVGSNGSGKSTLIKLVTRLLDPTSGEILIDGKPASSYSLSSLREAVASLTQEHVILPLSLRENICIGDPDKMQLVDSEEVSKMIWDSAVKSGAASISNFHERLDTTLSLDLRPNKSFELDETGLLQKEWEKLVGNTSLSGGEEQRIVAARMFMRMRKESVKLIVGDELTSALDPSAERNLLKNLLAERKGRTMIFVTHRFGDLVKSADLIVCMKDGQAVETGTHDELMARQGEYAKLHDDDIQSSASVSQPSANREVCPFAGL